MKFFLIAILWLTTHQNLLASKAREAQDLFEQKKYGEAAEKFLQAEVEDPDSFKHSYNRGVSDFKNGNFARAAEAFQKSAGSPDKEMQEKSLYNLGNALYKKGDLEGSVKAFEKALKVDPKNKKIADNKKWVEEQIKKQKQQQKKQKNDKNNKDKKDNKNSKDKNQSDSNKDQKKDQKKQDQQQGQKKEDQQQQDQSKLGDQKKQDQQNSESDKKKNEQQSSGKKKEQEQKKGQQGSSGSSPQDLKDKAKKEEVERMLRALEDTNQVYGAPPKIKSPASKPKKDW